jgi:hypothetical protein
MVKRHVFSAHSDLRTGFLCKFFLVLGGILLVCYLILILLHPIAINEDVTGAILAFSILLLGIGVILYYFSCQFAKLSKIAQEIESDESLKEDEEEKKSQ